MLSIDSVEPGIHGSVRKREAVPCLPSGIINDQYWIELNFEYWQYSGIINTVTKAYNTMILLNLRRPWYMIHVLCTCPWLNHDHDYHDPNKTMILKNDNHQAGVGSFSGGLAAHISHILPQTKVLMDDDDGGFCFRFFYTFRVTS